MQDGGHCAKWLKMILHEESSGNLFGEMKLMIGSLSCGLFTTVLYSA